MLRILRNIQGLKNSVNDILKLMIFQKIVRGGYNHSPL